MAYCTPDDIRQRIPAGVLADLTDDVSGEVVDDAIIAEMAESASSLMDSYFRINYSTPLSPVPEIVKHYCAWLTVYNLFSRRGILSDDPENTVRLNHDEVLAWLKQVAAKSAGLPVDEPARDEQIRFIGEDKLFTRTKMTDF